MHSGAHTQAWPSNLQLGPATQHHTPAAVQLWLQNCGLRSAWTLHKTPCEEEIAYACALTPATRLKHRPRPPPASHPRGRVDAHARCPHAGTQRAAHQARHIKADRSPLAPRQPRRVAGGCGNPRQSNVASALSGPTMPASCSACLPLKYPCALAPKQGAPRALSWAACIT